LDVSLDYGSEACALSKELVEQSRCREPATRLGVLRDEEASVCGIQRRVGGTIGESAFVPGEMK
jgi:hypothetical protein